MGCDVPERFTTPNSLLTAVIHCRHHLAKIQYLNLTMWQHCISVLEIGKHGEDRQCQALPIPGPLVCNIKPWWHQVAEVADDFLVLSRAGGNCEPAD